MGANHCSAALGSKSGLPLGTVCSWSSFEATRESMPRLEVRDDQGSEAAEHYGNGGEEPHDPCFDLEVIPHKIYRVRASWIRENSSLGLNCLATACEDPCV